MNKQIIRRNSLFVQSVIVFIESFSVEVSLVIRERGDIWWNYEMSHQNIFKNIKGRPVACHPHITKEKTPDAAVILLLVILSSSLTS